MKNKKTILVKKIIMGSISLIVIGLLSWYGISFGIMGQNNFFFQHFLACVCLVGIGVIAITLVYDSGSKLSENKNHESMMIIVGFGLMLLGLFSILFSFIIG